MTTNGVTMDWHVGAFGHYQLQSCTTLEQSAWNAVGGPVQAECTIIQLTDPWPTAGGRFYRLQQVGS